MKKYKNLIKIVTALVFMSFSFQSGYAATAKTTQLKTKTVSASTCTPLLKAGQFINAVSKDGQKLKLLVNRVVDSKTLEFKKPTGQLFKSQISGCDVTGEGEPGPQGIWPIIIGILVHIILEGVTAHPAY